MKNEKKMKIGIDLGLSTDGGAHVRPKSGLATVKGIGNKMHFKFFKNKRRRHQQENLILNTKRYKE